MVCPAEWDVSCTGRQSSSLGLPSLEVHLVPTFPHEECTEWGVSCTEVYPAARLSLRSPVQAPPGDGRDCTPALTTDDGCEDGHALVLRLRHGVAQDEAPDTRERAEGGQAADET